jgi:hypothetical protein
VADSGLNLCVKAALLLYFFHDLFHASPRVKSLKFQQIFLIYETLAVFPSEANAIWDGKFREKGTFLGLERSQPQQGSPGHPDRAF